MPVICPQCGTANRDHARFCDACGYPLTHIPPIDDPSELETGSDAITVDLPDDEAAWPGTAPTAPFGAGETVVLDAAAGTIPLDADATIPYPLDGLAASVPAPGVLPPSETQEMPSVASVADREQKAFRAQKPKKGGRSPRHLSKKAIIAIIAAACALIAAIVGGAYALELWGGKSVPNVVGLTEAEATDRLEMAGFTVSTVSVKSDDVEGIVLRSDPGAGQRAQEGSEIVLDISCARTVPDVIGKTSEEAMAQLKSEGFESVEVVEEKSNEAAGTIIAVSPEVGTRAKASAKITLTAAIPHLVPDCANMGVDEATAVLEAEGYAVKTAYTYTEEVAEGTVVSTDPAAGAELPSGSEVIVYIAKSRAAEVVAAAKAWFSASGRYTMNGMSYELQSVDDLTYKGDDTCAFAVTMRPYETHSWFGSDPETRYGNSQTVRGTMKFNQDGSLASIDPDLRRAQ